MYAEKKYELEDFKDAIKSEFYKMKQDVDFAGEIYRELGEAKTLL